MKCPNCDNEVKETQIFTINEDVYCSICVKGKEAREERLRKITTDAIKTRIEIVKQSKAELIRKINSCGDCKETKIKDVPLMCDKHWKECQHLEEERKEKQIEETMKRNHDLLVRLSKK